MAKQYDLILDSDHGEVRLGLDEHEGALVQAFLAVHDDVRVLVEDCEDDDCENTCDDAECGEGCGEEEACCPGVCDDCCLLWEKVKVFFHLFDYFSGKGLPTLEAAKLANDFLRST